MANVNAPHGLRPLMRTNSGGELSIRPFTKLASYGTALFINDAVNQMAGDATSGAVIQASATPGTTLYSGVNLNFGAASTLTQHQVLVNPDMVFEAQDDGSGSGFLAQDNGLNANLVLTAGVATTSKYSKHQVATSTKATTSTLDVKLIQLYGTPDNAYGVNARIEIIFNKHRMAVGSIAGV